MTAKLTIAAYRCNTGGTQITLSQTDENGAGWGRRLAGPKHHNLGTKELISAELDEADATELRRMLDAVFPLTATTAPCTCAADLDRLVNPHADHDDNPYGDAMWHEQHDDTETAPDPDTD